MKIINKSLNVLVLLLFAICCLPFTACENNNGAKTIVYPFDGQFLSGFEMGVHVIYDYEGADIEINKFTENTRLTVYSCSRGDNNNWLISGSKNITDECPYIKQGGIMLVWAPTAFFGSNELEDKIGDYISLIARREDKIVGYSVVYVWAVGTTGNGEVLADRECKDISEESVNLKIREIISDHKSKI